jgi:hypothetical protein
LARFSCRFSRRARFLVCLFSISIGFFAILSPSNQRGHTLLKDVILIHRLLKNTIPASEYITATRTFVELTGDYFSDTRSEMHQEYYDDLGMVTMQVFYPSNSHKISKKYRISS